MEHLVHLVHMALVVACAPMVPAQPTNSNHDPDAPGWVAQTTPTAASLRGVCAVSRRVAWASGSGGTVVRTVDGGETWQLVSVPGASELDFRDVEAFDADTAIVLSAGRPAKIYKTTDGGKTWPERYHNNTPGIFFDAMAFWDRRNGLAFGDPVDGRFVIIRTADGGDTWRSIPPQRIPVALPGEAGFAASGTCLAVHGDAHAWIGLGGPAARVLGTADRGQTWTVARTPIISGESSAGIFSLALRDEQHGVAVGGDYRKPDLSAGNSAFTNDGGATWVLLTAAHPRGYRSAVAYVPNAPTPTLLAVGPSGSDYSDDDGRTWRVMGDTGYHAISLARDGAGWAVGAEGRIARYDTK